VLAARAEGPLREAVGECERLGATALAVATDVRDESAVQLCSVWGRVTAPDVSA
jgi:hypothetical protein